MNEKMFKNLEDRLRKAAFASRELSDIELMFAMEYILGFMPQNVYSGDVKLTIPKTWNIKLFTNYQILQEFLLDKSNSDDLVKGKLRFVLTLIFIIKSLQKKNEDRYIWIAEKISDSYKESFVSNKMEDVVLFESKNIKITVSLKDRLVTMTDIKNRRVYKKTFEFSELSLFYGMKDFVTSKLNRK